MKGKNFENKKNQNLFDSKIIKVDFKERIEIQRANNKRRSKRNNADYNLVNLEGNIIDIFNLNKYYISKGNSTRVITDLNLSIKKGEFVVLFGKSGSGKTTLLNLMSGLDRPTSGNLIVCNKNLPFLSNTQLTTFRRENLSFIFQSYNLLTNLSGYDNVETGDYLQKDKSKKQDIKKMFEDFDLIDVIDKYPSQMSGGQQQRISILRALAKNSEIIFADEPTGALDKKTSKIVMELLQKINRELGKTIIMVSHDPGVIKYSTRVIKLSESRIISDVQTEGRDIDSILDLNIIQQDNSDEIYVEEKVADEDSYFINNHE
ncbi:MAG: ABC transporter ATP-binding protein [Metamycoplasmataceae bacterium]